ncbi:hypothetical protein MKY51_07480 [Solibacillus sp. FSL R5-0691]|uniref:hypothetical protein n=1 Tax=Solibacillus sp. FSL R5-0691 TaxID=2921653 RepID=UPI0030D3BCA4
MENEEIILSILKEIQNGITPVHTSYNLTLDMWADFIEYLDDRKYLTGVTIYWFGDDDEYYDERVHSVDLNKAKLTPFGEKFLAEQMN